MMVVRVRRWLFSISMGMARLLAMTPHCAALWRWRLSLTFHEAALAGCTSGSQRRKEARRRKEGRKESVCVMRKKPRPSMN